MKRRIISSLVTTITVLLPIFSQADWYFLTGCSTPKSPATFPSILYKMNDNHAVIEKKYAVQEDEGTEFIWAYPDLHLIVLKIAGGDGEAIYVLINMDNPDEIKRLITTYPAECGFIESNTFFVQNNGTYLSTYVSHKGEHLLLWQNVNGSSQEIMPWESYKYVFINGCHDTAGYPDSLLVKPTSNFHLFNSRGKYSTDLGYSLPNDIKIDEKSLFLMTANNNEFTVIRYQQIPSASLGEAKFLIFDKKNQNWHEKAFQGSNTRLRNYGKWLVGLVLADTREEKSPGYDMRRHEITKTGMPFEWRIHEFYSPGILVFYDMATQKEYHLDTHQGDSEVLMIDGTTVCYRINDEIYQAELTSDGITTSQVIVKNNVVPDIHWAFQSNEP